MPPDPINALSALISFRLEPEGRGEGVPYLVQCSVGFKTVSVISDPYLIVGSVVDDGRGPLLKLGSIIL